LVCKWTTCQAIPGQATCSRIAAPLPVALPLSPLYLPSPKPGRRIEVKPSQLSPRLASESLCSPYPDVPASFMGSPKLETTAQDLSLPSSSPKPAQTASPRSLSVPTAAAYKRPPFLAEKAHTITRNLPDILSSSPSPEFELTGDAVPADCRPGDHPFPANRTTSCRSTCPG
jgi:hypothetical protein